MTEKQIQLGKFVLLEKIGEGGFGTVYRGRDPLLDRDVAIKVLSAQKAAAPDFVERFRREARLAASLRHPNIVTVIEVGEQEGSYFMVMDYLPGGTLRQQMTDGAPTSLVRTALLLRPIAEALDYAHSRNIIHRDVKPANILFSEDDRPVLTDFGLVKSLTEQQDTTSTGMNLGTVEYMSPEQIQGHPLGPASDRYALGVVAYQLLTGSVPFKGSTPFEIQKGHVQEPPPDPRKLNPGLPADVAAIIQKALAKKPEGRYDSAVAFARELEAAAAQSTLANRSLIVREARAALERFDFAGAIQKFEKAQAIHASAEVAEQLAESRRRDGIWHRYQDLLARKAETRARLDELASQESWLPAEPTSFQNQKNQKVVAEKKQPNAWANPLLLGAAGAGIISMLLSLLFINSAPSEQTLRGFTRWQSFSYPFDYRLIDGLMVFSFLCYGLWLLVRLFPQGSIAKQFESFARHILTGGIILNIASMALSLIWIQQSPIQEAVRQTPTWNAFQYAVDYRVIFVLSSISIFLFVLWSVLQSRRAKSAS